ncbi:MAG: PD-(D/E)XK nuclease family protein, partial [Candidatus Hydrothermia bacterium]
LKEGIKVRVKGSLRKIQRSIADKIKGEIAGNFEGYRVEVKADSNLRVVGDVLLPFTGKIDRIDLYGDGVIIIDYKSSSSVESYERGAKIENLTKVLSEQGRVAHKIENPHIQLPVYYWLVKNSPQIRDTVGDLSNKRLFVSVVPLKSKDVKISIMEYENGESNAEQVEQCLRIITNEILDPSVEFYMPLESKRKTYCSRCSFNVICGTA